MKIKDLNIFNKRKGAALLAGMTLLTLPGCGKKNIEKDPQPGASVSIDEETITKEKDSTTKTGNTSTGKTTSSSTGTGTESTYVDNGTEYVEYTDSTEGYTEGQTEGQTEGKTETKTEGKTSSTGVQLPSDHRVGNSYEDPTEAKTTNKTTQKTTNKTTTTIKNNSIKVTTTAKPTTTKKVTTTTKVVTTQPTTQKPTEPPTTQPPAPTYDYRLENITQSAEVFNYFAEQMNHDIFQGKSILTKRLNGEELWLDGNKESKVALLLLNENENFNSNVLKEVFRDYSDADITNGIHYLYKNITETEKTAGTTTDFNRYVIDKDIGNYMNALQNAWKHAEETGDCSEMDKIIEDFLYTDIYDKQNYNAAACYYTYGVGAFNPNSAHHGICVSGADDGTFYGLQEVMEGRVKTLIR